MITIGTAPIFVRIISWSNLLCGLPSRLSTNVPTNVWSLSLCRIISTLFVACGTIYVHVATKGFVCMKKSRWISLLILGLCLCQNFFSQVEFWFWMGIRYRAWLGIQHCAQVGIDTQIEQSLLRNLCHLKATSKRVGDFVAPPPSKISILWL
jgi:hypothetical protein